MLHNTLQRYQSLRNHQEPLVGMMWPCPGRAGFCPWLCRLRDGVKKPRHPKPLASAALEAFLMKVTHVWRQSNTVLGLQNPSRKEGFLAVPRSHLKYMHMLSGRRGPSLLLAWTMVRTRERKEKMGTELGKRRAEFEGQEIWGTGEAAHSGRGSAVPSVAFRSGVGAFEAPCRHR